VANFREVIHSLRFDAELEALETDPRRADQAVHALTWALARHPERGFPVPGTQFSIWPVYLRGVEYVVYYRYTPSWVELLSLRASDEDMQL
jgi:hypothetical protein